MDDTVDFVKGAFSADCTVYRDILYNPCMFRQCKVFGNLSTTPSQ